MFSDLLLDSTSFLNKRLPSFKDVSGVWTVKVMAFFTAIAGLISIIIFAIAVSSSNSQSFINGDIHLRNRSVLLSHPANITSNLTLNIVTVNETMSMNHSTPPVMNVTSVEIKNTTLAVKIRNDEKVMINDLKNASHISHVKKTSSIDDDDIINDQLIEIPFVADEIWYRYNYFHTLQYFTRGIVDITNVASQLSTAERWRNIRLVWTGPNLTNTLEIWRNESDPFAPTDHVGQKLFEFFDGRFLPNGSFTPDSNHTTTAQVRKDLWKFNKRQVKSRLDIKRFWVHPMDQRAGRWIQLLAHFKFGIPIKKYSNKEWAVKNRERYCHKEFAPQKVSVLLISRDSDKRRTNLTDLANELERLNIFRKITHIPDLSKLSIKRQAWLFATHQFSIQPHGANEANLVFVNGPAQREGPPHVSFELACPYTDCHECQVYGLFCAYRNLIPWIWTFTIATESPKMNCVEFCDYIKRSPARNVSLRVPFRNPQIPTYVNGRMAIRMILEKLRTHIIPHCMGEKFGNPDFNSQPLRAMTVPFVPESLQLNRFRHAFHKVTGTRLKRTWY